VVSPRWISRGLFKLHMLSFTHDIVMLTTRSVDKRGEGQAREASNNSLSTKSHLVSKWMMLDGVLKLMDLQGRPLTS
jgi:hypothetical protein